MAASGFLSNNNVRYYHPLDNFTEFTENLVWAEGTGGDLQFVSSILVSGIEPVIVQPKIELSIGSGEYTDLTSVSGFTCAVWISGLLRPIAATSYISIGFGLVDDNFNTNAVLVSKNPGSGNFTIDSVLEGNVHEIDWLPMPPEDDDWHFFVADIRFETSGWRHRISLDGSDWLDLGVDTETLIPTPDTVARIVFNTDASPETIYDEVILWGDNDLFTDNELSNLYQLFNTHGTTMDQYIATFGTPANSGVNLFTEGNIQTSGDVFLYVPGQVEKKSLDLFINSFEPFNNMDLYISGIATPTSSLNLFTLGFIEINNNIDHIIMGFQSISGDFPLFIKGVSPDIDVFVGVVSNNPSDDLELIIHGGASGTSFTNKTTTLFINNSPEDISVDSAFSAFIKIADSTLTPASGIWQSFVKNNNVINNDIDLRIDGHASGSDPNGLLVTSSLDIFIEGAGELLSDGFFVSSIETLAFTKVHSGINNTSDLFVSGKIPVIPPSATIDLFIFGVLGIISGSHTLFIPSNELIDNTNNLFIFGVQGIESNNMLLFVEVTTLDLLDQEFNLYTHGF